MAVMHLHIRCTPVRSRSEEAIRAFRTSSRCPACADAPGGAYAAQKEVAFVEETNGEKELVRLTADAEAIDEELAALRPKANASRLGSADRKRYARLRDRSAAAWRRVFARKRR